MIFVDLDGVCVDFIGAALLLHGRDVEATLADWPNAVWDVSTVLGIKPAEFWKTIDEAGEDWWATLPAYPWMAPLLEMVAKKDDFIFATSPSRFAGSSSGKVRWMQRTFGRSWRSYMLGEHKHLFAKPGALLIDDNEAACEKFEAHGGKAILFPQPWNSLGRHADPLVFVKQRLEMLT